MGGLIDLLCRFVFKSSDAYLVLVISISSKYVSSSVYSFSLPWQPFKVSILIMMCVSWCVSWCVFHDVCFMMCFMISAVSAVFLSSFFFSRYSISVFSWSSCFLSWVFFYSNFFCLNTTIYIEVITKKTDKKKTIFFCLFR